jgi:hypothetical protein
MLKQLLLTISLCASSVEAFAPSSTASMRHSDTTKLDAAKIDLNLAKAAVVSALSFSLLFGATPALADGKHNFGRVYVFTSFEYIL